MEPPARPTTAKQGCPICTFRKSSSLRLIAEIKANTKELFVEAFAGHAHVPFSAAIGHPSMDAAI
jgi:hypothetical protein